MLFFKPDLRAVPPTINRWLRFFWALKLTVAFTSSREKDYSRPKNNRSRRFSFGEAGHCSPFIMVLLNNVCNLIHEPLGTIVGPTLRLSRDYAGRSVQTFALLLFVLRRFCEEENGAKIYPQRLAGGAEAQQPTGILSWAQSKQMTY